MSHVYIFMEACSVELRKQHLNMHGMFVVYKILLTLQDKLLNFLFHIDIIINKQAYPSQCIVDRWQIDICTILFQCLILFSVVPPGAAFGMQ